jgi:hypothetical protein
MVIQQIANSIATQATNVINITGLSDDLWFRKPKGARRGPWNTGVFEFVNEEIWNMSVPCIYFVSDGNQRIRYVGISANRLKDRWRLSPSYDSGLLPLNRKELFHSQCWPRMCAEYRSGSKDKYMISVLHFADMKEAIEATDPRIISISDFDTNSNNTFEYLESWFIKTLSDQLWNIKP